MEDSESDKSELPTPFKLMRARGKGTVARGVDLGFFTALASATGFAWAFGGTWYASLEGAFRGVILESARAGEGDDIVLRVVAYAFMKAGPALAGLAVLLFASVLLFELVQTGVVFSSGPLKPDFSRLNPARVLKRVFSLRLLIETMKNVTKLCVYAAVGYFVTRNAVLAERAANLEAHGLFLAMAKAAGRLLLAFLLVAACFAALDQIIVRRDFLKRMRMSRRELRREAREREGEPRLKQRRKQLHAEFTKRRESLRNIRSADVLITNPEHLAVGLRYDARRMHAPMVIAIGRDNFALQLKRLALRNSVPVIENRQLARALYAGSGLNRYVPEECFRDVADVYNNLKRKKRAVMDEENDV